MKRVTLRHEFVKHIPQDIEEGTIYISIDYATALHKCCCGCGNEVVTPLSPTDWKLVFDGESVSLDPSIGNWSFPCQSHYWIRGNNVRWSRRWSQEEINAGRAFDSFEKHRYFSSDNSAEEPDKNIVGDPALRSRRRKTLWQKVKDFLS